MIDNGFSHRYAIRMPDGRLYAYENSDTLDPADDYSVTSPARDMFSMMGMFMPTPKKSQKCSGIVIFDNEAEATKLLEALRETAASVGVAEWGGSVVAQLCTPFTSHDPCVQFAQAVIAWMRQDAAE